MDDKIKETQSVRLHLDLRLTEPHNAYNLHELVEEVEDKVRANVSLLAEARVTEIIPTEGERFDWGDKPSG